MGNCVPVQQRQPTVKESNHIHYILHSYLANLMQTHSNSLLNDYLIIDVRDELIDYEGGHIGGSMHISDKVFPKQICDVFMKYNAKKKIIIYDMYGVTRSRFCYELYSNYKKQIISNYSNKTQTSFYYIIADENDDEKLDEEYDEENPKKERIIINNCDQQMIANLVKQEIFVLKGGFFELINSSYSRIIVGFDQKMWEQLEITALYEQKRWYHKNEYFAKAKFAELKKKNKSRKFKGFSSNDNKIAFLKDSVEFKKTFKTYLD